MNECSDLADFENAAKINRQNQKGKGTIDVIKEQIIFQQHLIIDNGNPIDKGLKKNKPEYIIPPEFYIPPVQY